jgi:hypothetical protein
MDGHVTNCKYFFLCVFLSFFFDQLPLSCSSLRTSVIAKQSLFNSVYKGDPTTITTIGTSKLKMHLMEDELMNSGSIYQQMKTGLDAN